MLPKDSPKEFLFSEQLTDIQDAIMDEVINGWKKPLAFTGVTFRPGLLIADCKDSSTAEWLTNPT